MDISYSFFNKRTCFLAGILTAALVIFEHFLFIGQPFISSGFTFDLKNEAYIVKTVSKDSPASRLGIKKNDKIIRMNGFSVQQLHDFWTNRSFHEYKMFTGSFFSTEKPLLLEFEDNTTKELYLFERKGFENIKNTPFTLQLKLLVSLISIICGLFCVLQCGDNEKIRPLSLICFTIAIAIENCLSSDFFTMQCTNITQILFDAGVLLTLTSTYIYIDRVFSYSRNYKSARPYFKLIDCIPAVLFGTKYILIGVFPNWNVSGNPLQNLSQFMLIFVLICSLFMMIYILVNFPRQITITFRFFILAIVLAISPAVFIKLEDIFTKSYYSCILDECLTILPFLYLPVFITNSIIQGWGRRANKFVIFAGSFVSYASIGIVTLYVLETYFAGDYKTIFISTFLLLQPIVFIAIQKVFEKFLSIDVTKHNKEISAFEQRISTVDTHIDLYKMTTVEIIKTIDSSFVFFYIKNESNGTWEIPYLSNPSIPRDYVFQLITEVEESKSKTIIQTITDDCFVVPVMKADELCAQIYIGHKNNMEYYVPGEHAIIQLITDAFYKEFLVLDNKKAELQLQKNNANIIKLQENTIIGMANLIESRDGSTGEHVKQTAKYVKLLAEYAMQHGYYSDIIDDDYIRLLVKAAPLHDVGKVVVSDALLKKPDKFTPAEFEEMKRHTIEGGRVVKEVLGDSADPDQLKITTEIATYHHEKWNGTGYPNKLKGETIPLCARIMAVADVFDALVSPRCYKEPMNIDKAFSIIEEEAGTHFDPTLARLFVENKEAARAIALSSRNN